MAHDVFISYSHKDKAVADAIVARLEQDNCRCWYAPRDIAPGADWAASIIEAIESTKVMVLVFTDFSNASRQVLREINNAVRTGAVIVPFRLTDSSPSGGMQYYLSTVHWLDAMDEPLEDSIAQLSELVRSVLDGAPKPVGHAPIPAAESPAPRKRNWIVPAALAGIALCALLLLLPGRTRSGEPSPAETAQPTAAAAEESAPTAAPEKKTSAPSAGKTSGVTGEYMFESAGGAVTLQKYLGSERSEVVVPDTIEGMPVVALGEKCFNEHTEIESLTLPESLRSIGYRAFYGCKNLTGLTFPASLETIEGWAFAHTGLGSVTLPEGMTKLGYGAFYSCLNLTEVTLPEGVTELGEDTFRLCYRLRRVTFPAADPSIHLKAFDEKGRVTLVGVPGSYTETYALAMELAFEAYTP